MQIDSNAGFARPLQPWESSNWIKLQQADLKLVPTIARAWTLDVYSARLQPTTLRSVWQRSWSSIGMRATDSEASQLLSWLYAIGLDLAEVVETDMRQANLAYHNATHVQDVLLVCTHMLNSWKGGRTTKALEAAQAPPWCSLSAASLMLAALCHDWGHNGNPTSSTPTLESHARDLLIEHWPHKQPDALLSAWMQVQHTAGELILATELQAAHALHHRYSDLGSDSPVQVSMQDWLAILITEADIAASLLPCLGWELSARIRQEQVTWCQQQRLACTPDSAYEVATTRAKFLLHTKISSVCAHHLGMPELASLSHRLTLAKELPSWI